MEDDSSKSRDSRWPWGLIGMVVLIVAAERFVVGHDLDYTDMGALNWSYSKRAAVSEARKSGILSLGSSTLKFGIVSRVIESGTGRPTFDLAMCGSDMAANYFVLRRALEAGARPAAVLIDCHIAQDTQSDPEVLYRPIRNWPEVLSVRDTLDLGWTARDARFLATVLVSRLFPSYKARFAIRASVLAALRGGSSSASSANRWARDNWRRNRGSFLIEKNPEYEAKHRGETVQARPQELPADAPGDNLPDGTYARRFLDLAAAHKIRVFYLLPPLPPDQRDVMIRNGSDLKSTRFARTIQGYHPDLVVIDGRRSSYPSDTFIDDAHMNAQGARVFSAEVASVVKRHLSGTAPEPRWVTLPPYSASDTQPDPASGATARSNPVPESGVQR
jgi:hypothetical protein